MALVLLVEDDPEIREVLELYLQRDGHKVSQVGDGRSALQRFNTDEPDLVLLDIGLPKISGIDLLKHIRERTRTPVIMLTARSEEVDELLGLGLGADAYLTKPCSPRKVMAHVEAVLRRSGTASAERVFQVGLLEVDMRAMRAAVRGEELRLTPTEFRLLAHLAVTEGKAVTRKELFQVAMPESGAVERAIDVHLKNVRHKLARAGAEGLLKTVRGIGYRLAEE